MSLLSFYKRAGLLFAALLPLSVLALWGGYAQSQRAIELLPKQSSVLPWQPKTVALPEGGSNWVKLNYDQSFLDFSFYRDDQSRWPYTAFGLNFYDAQSPVQTVDLSTYDSIQFKVLCQPANMLSLVFHTHDVLATDPADHNTFRVSDFYFGCDHHWKTVSIPLDEVKTPAWWLDRFGISLTDRTVRLDASQTYNLGFIGTAQSPTNQALRIQISDIVFSGVTPFFIQMAYAFTGIIWLVFVLWALVNYSRALVVDVKERVNRDQQLIAYKKLSIAPQKDKEKSGLLRYMATEYGNPDLSMEVACSALGLNRTKINELLKEELGLTFSVYLNKLRLTEAARLLSEEKEANVSEVAHAVGYNNVSYFGKLFKTEYGCTPKSFQSMYRDTLTPPES